jgi:AcrR family transcriptional regulator
MAPRVPREQKKALTRKALLGAASILIARHGADATSLDSIAEEAGFTKGAIYSNFKNKEDLLFALAEATSTTIELSDVIDRARPLVDQFEAIGRMVAREGRTISRLTWRLQLEIFQFVMRNPAASTKVIAIERAGRETDGALLDEVAAERGEPLPMTGAELVTVTAALALGLVQKQAIDPKGVPDELFAKAFRVLAGGAALGAADDGRGPTLSS